MSRSMGPRRGCAPLRGARGGKHEGQGPNFEGSKTDERAGAGAGGHADAAVQVGGGAGERPPSYRSRRSNRPTASPEASVLRALALVFGLP